MCRKTARKDTKNMENIFLCSFSRQGVVLSSECNFFRTKAKIEIYPFEAKDREVFSLPLSEKSILPHSTNGCLVELTRELFIVSIELQLEKESLYQ